MPSFLNSRLVLFAFALLVLEAQMCWMFAFQEKRRVWIWIFLLAPVLGIVIAVVIFARKVQYFFRFFIDTVSTS
jgi:hypothetical protein